MKQKLFKNQKEIEELLLSTKRKNISQVTAAMVNKGFYLAKCVSHHYNLGGLAEHALDVCKRMLKSKNCGKAYSRETAIIVSLCHDAGKMFSMFWHEVKSIEFLEKFRVELTAMEKTAILNHHKISFDLLSSPLRRDLTLADISSSRAWLKENKKAKRKSLA
jgi:hypothetical protein